MKIITGKWLYVLTIAGYIVVLTNSCKKDRGDLPVLTTSDISDIKQTSAICGGNITSIGSSSIIDQGVCWSININPTIEDSKNTNGSTLRYFTRILTGLKPNTAYYVRAFATSSVGTGYGSTMSFTTLSLQVPMLTTTNVKNITKTTAICGGTISEDGGSAVTSRGVCWSTIENPTIDDLNTKDGSDTGNFVSNLSGLDPGTYYYARAYATNNLGTGYGNVISFATPITKIGETYAGGIVFYIDSTGQHGLVSCGSVGEAKWSCSEFTGAYGIAIGTGAQNTTEIVASCPTDNTAANICDSLKYNGYTDWFLPSKDELNMLVLQKKLFGNNWCPNSAWCNYSPSKCRRYWSSTQYNNNFRINGHLVNVCFQDFCDGGTGAGSNDNPFLVFAVRAF